MTEQRREKRRPGKRREVKRALYVILTILLGLAHTGCVHYYYLTVDRVISQSNVELVKALTEPPVRGGVESMVSISDSVLAIADFDGVHIMDVGDPGEPSLIGVHRFAVQLDFPFVSIAHMDGYVYVTNSTDELIVIDVRDVTSPRVANRVRGARGRVAAAEDGFLYLYSVLRKGLQVWDARRAPDVAMMGVYYPPQARVGANRIHKRHRMPPIEATPRQVAAERQLGDFSVNSVNGAQAHCAGGLLWGGVDAEGGLLYMGVSDADCRDEGGVRRKLDDGGLWIVNVVNPKEPFPIGFVPLGDARIDDVTVEGNYAYLALGPDGLKIVDVSDPTKPVLVGGHATPGLSRDVEVEDGIAYVMNTDSVQVFNVDNPAKPVRIGLMSEAFYVLSEIAVRDNHIYLAGQNNNYWESKMFVLRLIDPEARPAELLWGAASD